jgi:5-methyltetrahydropteroyltriglutamate--homocysteine methyltransferase
MDKQHAKAMRTPRREHNELKHLRQLRVDQIGSLVAPLDLRKAFERYANGEVSADQLKSTQDSSIKAVIRKQERLGFPVISDGEFRRVNFQDSFGSAVDGFDVPEKVERLNDWREPNKPLQRTEQNFEANGPAILTRRPVTERLSLKRNVIREEYSFAAEIAAAPVKVSLIGPDRIVQRFAWERSQPIYADADEFASDVVAIQRTMISETIEDGCRYIHVDAPGFTAYVDSISLERMRSRGEDPQRNFERAIRIENEVISGIKGAIFGLHICRGNVRGIDPATGQVMPQWHREGSYDGIAEQLFGTLNHDRFLLEYDSDRSGGFEPLRFVPRGKIVVLGIVSTKSEVIESVEHLLKQVDAAAKYLPYEQLSISPQCGFSSGVSHVQIAEDVQWRKLESLLVAAEKIWGTATIQGL